MLLLKSALNVQDQLVVIAGDVESGAIKLKDAKVAITELADSAPADYRTRLTTMAKVRTGKALDELLGTFKEYVQGLQIKADELAQDGIKGAPTELDLLCNIAVNINDLLEQRMNNTLSLGQELSSAKGVFSKQADFLVWAKAECGLGKSQVFKLIRIFETFGNEPAFKSVSMRVLYTLSSYTPQDEVFQRAEEVIEAREVLDTPRLTRIIQEVEQKAAPKTETVPELELIEDLGTSIEGITVQEMPELSTLEQAPEDDAEDLEGLDDVAPFDLGTDFEPAQAPKPERAADTGKDDLIRDLTKQIAELTEALSQAQSAQAAQAPKAYSLPELPQFDEDDACTVLGIPQSKADDKAAVKKAYRHFAKLYSGNTNVTDKLLAARKALGA